MITLFRLLAKGCAVFLLWALVGAGIYALGDTLMGRPSMPGAVSGGGLSAVLALPPVVEQFVEGDAVLVTTAAEDPTDLEFDLEGTGYLLDGSGLIFRLRDGSREILPWLVLVNEKTERAVPFRALALHPGFLDEGSRGHGRFYTIEPELAGAGEADFAPEHGGGVEHHQDVLCEYRTVEPGSRVFTGSRKVLARFSQPGPGHNVSDLAFDRVGRLFVAVGDGASGAPGSRHASRNAMSLENVYGKILRLDPLGSNSANGRYGVPPRNPFLVIEGALPEIWCYGLRDPRRIQFDPYRDWLSIIDAGPDGIEEINISEQGGEHFGWDLCEGSFFYPPGEGKKPGEGVTGPRAELARAGEAGLAGGFIYQGEKFPALRGRLMFATSCGRLMTARADGSGNISRLLVGNQRTLSDGTITGIRPGPTGELFILSRAGVYQLEKQNAAARPKKAKRPLLCWAL